MKLKRALALVCAAQLIAGSALAADSMPASIGPISWAQMPLNYQPAPDSDEAGLWMSSDQAEMQLRGSPLIVSDPALNTYVRSIVCKLSGPYCASIRVYILDVPEFNASMAPNGEMQVYTGLLLRAQNEAQLSFVLGHELTHYLLCHTRDQYRRVRNSLGAMAVISLVTAGAGVGLAGSLINLGIAGSLMSFSRDEEREADSHGFDLAIAAGYDPAQSAGLWQELYDEEQADPHKDGPGIFGTTHPQTAERLKTLEDRATATESQRSDWQSDAQAYAAAMKPFRAQWLAENLTLGHYEQSLVLAKQLLQSDPNSADLHYFQGEIYRRRNADGDAANAIAAYNAAIAAGGAPNAVYRGLGLELMKTKDNTDAKTAFQKYLASSPDDHAMVEYYLTRL